MPPLREQHGMRARAWRVYTRALCARVLLTVAPYAIRRYAPDAIREERYDAARCCC